ncbi:MAG: MATE family efflux transporter, partial [Sphaerochaetaceae bacterium]
VGMAAMNQCYSLRGLKAVAAFNISSTIMNLFNVVLFSIGASLGVIVGNILGSGDMEKAVDYDRKIIAFSTFICVLIGAVMFASAPLFPKLYNTSEEAKAIAADVIRIAACFLPVVAMKNGSYYTLRSGGRTYITMAFDSGMIWTISLPIAYFLSRFTDMNPVLIFLFVQLGDIIKVIIGLILVKGKVWLRNIVS